MHSSLNWYLAQARIDDLRRAGGERPIARFPRLPRRPAQNAPVTLRFGFPDDSEALARVATLDSAPALAEPVLLAEVGGELRAALSLSDGAVVADPFHPSTAVVELLRARARQLQGIERRPLRRRLRPWFRTRLVTWR